jgi:protocatechuate 3,4-dioxygenase beta subunit
MNAGGDHVALTDTDGRYRIANLPEGNYELRVMLMSYIAEKEQWTNDNYLVRSITLHKGETLNDVDFSLVRGGVITGRVTDADGHPIISGLVYLQVVYADGRKQPHYSSVSRQMYETDDRGVYRIFGLRAGRYLVSLDAEAGVDYFDLSGGTQTRTWHPDTTDMNRAKIIEVKEGGEVTDVDIRFDLAKRTRGAAVIREQVNVAGDALPEGWRAKLKREGAITGHVTLDGRPVAAARVFVYSAAGKHGEGQTTTSDEDGVFKTTGLRPGAYSVMTLTPGYLAPSDSPKPRIYRTGENVTMDLVKGGVITGRVTDEFGAPMVGVRVMFQKVRTLEGAPDFDSTVIGATSAGRETDDRGVYRIFGLKPGVYVVNLNSPSSSMRGFAEPLSKPPVYLRHPLAMRRRR